MESAPKRVSTDQRPVAPEGVVWSIMDNAWVTREYWAWVNGRSPR